MAYGPHVENLMSVYKGTEGIIDQRLMDMAMAADERVGADASGVLLSALGSQLPANAQKQVSFPELNGTKTNVESDQVTLLREAKRRA